MTFKCQTYLYLSTFSNFQSIFFLSVYLFIQIIEQITLLYRLYILQTRLTGNPSILVFLYFLLLVALYQYANPGNLATSIYNNSMFYHSQSISIAQVLMSFLRYVVSSCTGFRYLRTTCFHALRILFQIPCVAYYISLPCEAGITIKSYKT